MFAAQAPAAMRERSRLLREMHEMHTALCDTEAALWNLRLPLWTDVLRLVNTLPDHEANTDAPRCACVCCCTVGVACASTQARDETAPLKCKLQPYMFALLTRLQVDVACANHPQRKKGVDAGSLRPKRDDVYVGASSVVARNSTGELVLFDRDGMCSGWGEPVASLAWIAGVTSKIRLGIGVLVVPYRDPVLTAKMVATIDQLSGGRLDLGVGTGWARSEYHALGRGALFADRGAVTDDWLAAQLDG